MFQPNVARVESIIRENWKVLDVGGWYQPFRRADVVVDLMDYDSRGLGGHYGAGSERFSAESWIVHDICKGGLPFYDGEFDYVICSHTLEDVRDPVAVCSELMRVARAGYIEVPSRLVESVRGLEGRNYVGYYHHRWLVEITDSSVSFRFKPHAIHEDRRYHLPHRFLKDMCPKDRVNWLFWEGSFGAQEVIQISHLATRLELAQFASKHAPLTLVERANLLLRAPAVARQYRSWGALLRPLDVHCAGDPPQARKMWAQLPEVESGM